MLEIIENNGNYFIDPNPSRILLNEVRSFKKSKKLICIFNTSLRERTILRFLCTLLSHEIIISIKE